MKKLFSLIIIGVISTLAMAVTGFAQPSDDVFKGVPEVVSDEILTKDGLYKYHELSDGTIKVVYLGGEKNVVIPEKIDGKTVSMIASFAFEGTEVEKITLPETITVIESQAFGRSLLTEIDIPDSVKVIGSSAFEHTPILENHKDGIVYIDGWAVGIQGELSKKVTLNDDTVGIANNLFFFSDCEEIVLNEGLKYIGSKAFERSSIKNISLPKSLEMIGDSAFEACLDLKEINIPKNVNYIGERFVRSGLYTVKVTIPPENKYFKIEDNIVYSSDMKRLLCPSEKVEIEKYIIPNTVETVDSYAFYDRKIKSVVVSENIKIISPFAFYTFYLEEVILSQGLEEIGKYAFGGAKIKELKLPKTLSKIGVGAFSDCSNLENIFVENGNENYIDMDGVLFSADKKNIILRPITKSEKHYDIPEGVEVVADFCFQENELESVTLPSSLREIGMYAFSDNKLIEIGFPSGLESIGYSAFEENELISVTLPKTLKNIGEDSFANNKIETLIIESPHTKIGEYAFWKNNLKELSFPHGTQTINDGVFEKNALTKVNIPDTVTEIGDEAFFDNPDLSYIEIPKSVVHIGDDAFGFYYKDDSLEKHKIKDFKLKVYDNYAGHEYALENDFDTEIQIKESSVQFKEGEIEKPKDNIFDSTKSSYTFLLVTLVGVMLVASGVIVFFVMKSKKQENKKE